MAAAISYLAHEEARSTFISFLFSLRLKHLFLKSSLENALKCFFSFFLLFHRMMMTTMVVDVSRGAFVLINIPLLLSLLSKVWCVIIKFFSLLFVFTTLDDGGEFDVVELSSLNGGFLPGLLDLLFAELVSCVH